jgi:predicted DNA-binding antitoxin AbrB/MazE fold protein
MNYGGVDMQACKAYYENGRFVPLEILRIPEGSEAIVTVLDNKSTNEVEKRRNAWKEFFTVIESSNEPTPDFEQIHLNREVDL